MKKFLLLIIALYLVLCPFYLFDSGMPQPSDIIAAIGIVAFILSGNIKLVYNLPISKTFKWLVGVITIINITYFMYFENIGEENRMFMPALFYIFNLLFFFMFISFFMDTKFMKNSNWISLFIIISLSIQSVLAALGIQGGAKEEITSRGTIFFNNPNQLGYYALLMLTLFAVLPSKYRSNKITFSITLILSTYLILSSGSRAALGGALLLGIIMLYNEGFKVKLSSIVLLITAAVSFVYFLQTDFLKKRIDLIETRNERFQSTNVTEAQVRGYDRFWLHPEYVFYGAGEGKNDRFNSFHKLEMHSGFGTMLFSYGFIGLFLFLKMIYIAVRKKPILYLALLSPILIYNITHQGLRDPLLWGVLGAIYIILEKRETHERK